MFSIELLSPNVVTRRRQASRNLGALDRHVDLVIAALVLDRRGRGPKGLAE
jgi:hypothetical protein